LFKQKGVIPMAKQFSHGSGDDQIRARVSEVLVDIREALRRDGGDVELVDVVDGVVQVRLTGACRGCPMASQTLTHGVESVIKERIPEVTRVEALP
jgi:Fe-S cluster biogenesis protein NfuA